jgi:hypothetical protein
MEFILSSMKHTFGMFVLCAVIGAAVTGCNPSHDGTTKNNSTSTVTGSPTRAAAAASSTGIAAAAAPPGAAVTASPTGASARPTTGPATAPSSSAPAADVGVVADCASAEPHTLSREPSSIVLTCADAGIRIEGLTWVTWTDSAAAGHGTLWENQCVPSCAEGKFAKYPVAVALFAVRSSADGPWFSRLKLTWAGNRPPNQTPDTWTLMPPGSGPMPL